MLTQNPRLSSLLIFRVPGDMSLPRLRREVRATVPYDGASSQETRFSFPALCQTACLCVLRVQFIFFIERRENNPSFR
jgi:hypothetical protein